MIYLDSAAIVKLIRPEAETADLLDWLNDRLNDVLVSSALTEIEVPRALRRSDPGRLVGVPTVLAKINKLEIDSAVRATAAAYDDPNLRSLDAIHLASAHSLVLEGKKLIAFVTYDKRLLAAVSAAGLPVASPGMN
ncbi:ribonuclease VapC [Lentzea sp. NBRC 105346]|uniref:type II toxin-antitoxin system VapC family toxin n=1 Tax=Lentzea sp. NBRC 105346 TaxID=3032205 RepID=UPI0024A53A66|nr:type II toxin-antitoxin system VapC family toxin [Lentzea sp. NBRC 105346]GLZ32924.1 ribonuclease VapC [Lentzea sp. NBRC 105346]